MGKIPVMEISIDDDPENEAWMEKVVQMNEGKGGSTLQEFRRMEKKYEAWGKRNRKHKEIVIEVIKEVKRA